MKSGAVCAHCEASFFPPPATADSRLEKLNFLCSSQQPFEAYIAVLALSFSFFVLVIL